MLQLVYYETLLNRFFVAFENSCDVHLYKKLQRQVTDQDHWKWYSLVITEQNPEAQQLVSARGSKMEQVKLIGYWVSPFYRSVEIALNIKGIQYEYIEEDLTNKSPQLLQYNPVYNKIPVLVHNGKPIVESMVILEYSDETWKNNPILPKDPFEKATARFWANFVDRKCFPALWKIIWSTGEQYEQNKAEALECLKVLENELGGKRFFGGGSVGMVDIVANFIGFSFRTIQEALKLDVFTEDNFPKLWEWAENYVNCSHVKKCLPPKDKLIANFPPAYMGKALVSSFQSRLQLPSPATAK